ncbi:MAG: hypothetical protein WA397_23290 [Roseiarcus sp.]
MSTNVSRSSDYEAQANRLRADMGSTIEQLRLNLTPSNLASEAASRVGVADLSWSGALNFAGKRHPVPTAIIGLGIALWTLAAVRGRARGGASLASLSQPLTESSSSLVDSATKVLRERAEAKRQEFVGTAQAQVVSGAEKLSDEIEKRVENIIVGVPGANRAQPLIASAIQIGLAALLEGLLRKRSIP